MMIMRNFLSKGRPAVCVGQMGWWQQLRGREGGLHWPHFLLHHHHRRQHHQGGLHIIIFASISFTAIDIIIVIIIVIIVVFLCPFCGICQKSSTMVGSLGHRQLCPNQRMKRRELKQDHDATIQHGRLEWKARADNAITLKRFMQWWKTSSKSWRIR